MVDDSCEQWIHWYWTVCDAWVRSCLHAQAAQHFWLAVESMHYRSSCRFGAEWVEGRCHAIMECGWWKSPSAFVHQTADAFDFFEFHQSHDTLGQFHHPISCCRIGSATAIPSISWLDRISILPLRSSMVAPNEMALGSSSSPLLDACRFRQDLAHWGGFCQSDSKEHNTWASRKWASRKWSLQSIVGEVHGSAPRWPVHCNEALLLPLFLLPLHGLDAWSGPTTTSLL